jgi:hypothetical protein
LRTLLLLFKTADQGSRTPYWDFKLGKTLLEQMYIIQLLKPMTKVLRGANRASWKTFCGEVDGIIPFARLHRVLSKDVSNQMGALRLPSGYFTSLDGEAAKHLLMTHFPGRQPIEEHHRTGTLLRWLSARTK